MKVSIITVSYNSEQTIRDTFESVRFQDLDGFTLEYILVDGLSTDSTMIISRDYDDIINVSLSEQELGIYNAMNKGVSLATGDIIGFLNSDDTFSQSDSLRKVVRCFTENKTLDIVYGDIDYVDSNGEITRRWRTGAQKAFSKGWHPAHPGFYARKELFQEYGGFDEKLSIAADFDLMLRFIEVANSNTKYLEGVLVKMKLGGESNRSLKNIREGNRQIIQSFNKYSITPQFLYTVRRLIRKAFQSWI